VPIKFLQFHWQQKHSAEKATTIYSPKEAQGYIKNLIAASTSTKTHLEAQKPYNTKTLTKKKTL